MPREISDKMGIKFVSLPEEREHEKDSQLLAIIMNFLDENKKTEIKELLGEDYFNLKMKKATKALKIKENKGKTIDISKNPGSTISALE